MTLGLSRRGAVDPFIVMDVMKAAADCQAEGKEVLHLEVGQPGASAPRGALEAVRRASVQSNMGYTAALGLPKLREGIARHYSDFYGLSVPAERIAVTTGSSGAFLLAFLASFDSGARVAMAAPGYPAYRNILKALSIEPVMLEGQADAGYQPTPELLERAGRLDGLIVASPSNPTGTMLGEAAFKRLVAFCRQQGVRLISDEIYHGISYSGRPVSAAALEPEAIIINSFSKYYCMTGWRLGWLLLPSNMVRQVERLAQNFFISPPAVAQIAGLAALDCREELDQHVAAYARNRGRLLSALAAAGVDKVAPADGAFYIYADVGHLTNDSTDFCRRALAEIGVAMTPGVDFDPARGHRSLRLSFAGDETEVARAAERLTPWLQRATPLPAW